MLGEDDVDWGQGGQGGQVPLSLLHTEPAQLGGLQDDLSGVCGGKCGLAGAELARAGLGSVFLQKFLFLSPESCVEVAVEDH